MITQQDLFDYGFTENKDSDSIIFPYEKIIAENEEGVLGLVVTTIQGQEDIAIVTPTGELIFVSAIKDLEQLKVIESSITGWDGN